MTGYSYKSYSFVDKDPMIDYIRTIIHESGETLTKISENSGVGQQTISKWLYGETMQPRAASINAVLRALGYKLEIVTFKYTQVIKPTFLTKAKTYSVPKKVKKELQKVVVDYHNGENGE
jgi:transcriptional regulator with XRE-family HTH domain